MGRARFFDIVWDEVGRPVSLANVEVFESGTTAPLDAVIYAARTGSEQRTNPFMTGPDGEVLFYLDLPTVVDVRYSKDGLATETHSVDVMSADMAGGGGGGEDVSSVELEVTGVIPLWEPPIGIDMVLIKPTGALQSFSAWQPNLRYIVYGENGNVEPVISNGHWYQAVWSSGGYTGETEPDWNQGGVSGDFSTTGNTRGTPFIDGLWAPGIVVITGQFVNVNGLMWQSIAGEGEPTDIVEPDWTSAPNVFDTVVDGGVTWQRTASVVELWAPLTRFPLPSQDNVIWFQPSMFDGTWWNMQMIAGQSGEVEPEWPIDGGQIIDGDLLWTDQGAPELQPAQFLDFSVPPEGRGRQIIVVHNGGDRLTLPDQFRFNPNEWDHFDTNTLYEAGDYALFVYIGIEKIDTVITFTPSAVTATGGEVYIQIGEGNVGPIPWDATNEEISAAISSYFEDVEDYAETIVASFPDGFAGPGTITFDGDRWGSDVDEEYASISDDLTGPEEPYEFVGAVTARGRASVGWRCIIERDSD